MIILHVTQTLDSKEARDSFVSELKAAGIPQASQAEAGNICYDYYFSPDDDKVLLILEKWEDQEALDFHSNAPHFKAITPIKKKYNVTMTIEKFVVD